VKVEGPVVFANYAG